MLILSWVWCCLDKIGARGWQKESPIFTLIIHLCNFFNISIFTLRLHFFTPVHLYCCAIFKLDLVWWGCVSLEELPPIAYFFPHLSHGEFECGSLNQLALTSITLKVISFNQDICSSCRAIVWKEHNTLDTPEMYNICHRFNKDIWGCGYTSMFACLLGELRPCCIVEVAVISSYCFDAVVLKRWMLLAVWPVKAHHKAY